MLRVLRLYENNLECRGGCGGSFASLLVQLHLKMPRHGDAY